MEATLPGSPERVEAMAAAAACNLPLDGGAYSDERDRRNGLVRRLEFERARNGKIISKSTDWREQQPVGCDAGKIPGKISRNIRELRLARGWSQSQFAARLGVTQQAAAKLECADSDPKISTVEAVAHALGVTLGRLVGSG